MKVLIAMAVNNTVENERFKYTKETIESLLIQKVNLKHELFIINNGSCPETLDYINRLPNVGVILNTENLGTARAINQAWQYRQDGQHCIKMDDDVVIHCDDWVEQMIEAIERDNSIGIIGLKRKDLIEHPKHPDPNYKSTLRMLPHKNGEKWIIVEESKHVIGTCQMYNHIFLQEMGYLYQPGLYGYDDVIACHKSHIAGYKNVFLPHIEIEHIDDGANPYTGWKREKATEQQAEVMNFVNEMLRGERPIYQEFY